MRLSRIDHVIKNPDNTSLSTLDEGSALAICAVLSFAWIGRTPMHRCQWIRATSLVLTASLALAACGQQDQTPSDSPSQAAATTPVGNAVSMTAADCERLPDPKSSEDSAAGRAAAAARGSAPRAACQKAVVASPTTSDSDLARIRQIMEKEEAERAAQKAADKEYGRRLSEAGKAPLKQYKY